MKIAKYRPVLTSSQITHIVSLCIKSMSDESLSVVAVLAPFKAKIEFNKLSPAYVMQEKKTLTESLGFENDPNNIGLSGGEIRDKAYDKWMRDPESCNAEELGLAREERYYRNEMTLEERAAFNADMQKIVYESLGVDWIDPNYKNECK